MCYPEKGCKVSRASAAISAAYASGSLVLGVLQQVDDFLDGGVFEAFALVAEGFGEANGEILHVFVGFLGAADQEKLFAASDTFVAVRIIQADAEQADHLFLGFLLGRHR